MHYTVAQKAWKRYALAAGVPEATIQQLRHFYGSALINGGMRVEALQRAMGHRNIQTTMAYAAVSDETVKRGLAIPGFKVGRLRQTVAKECSTTIASLPISFERLVASAREFEAVYRLCMPAIERAVAPAVLV